MERIYERQLDFFDPTDAGNQHDILIVGAGTIGSWTALGLAKLGLQHITVWDFDKVEIHNTPNQLYSPKDVESPKVAVLSEIIKDLTGIDVTGVISKFPPKLDKFPPSIIEHPSILISAVDSMKSRNSIFEWAEESDVRFLIDGRMGGEVFMLYTVDMQDVDHVNAYRKTLYSDDSSNIQNARVRELSDVPCTANGIIDVSFIMASVMVNAVRKAIRNYPWYYLCGDMGHLIISRSTPAREPSEDDLEEDMKIADDDVPPDPDDEDEDHELSDHLDT